MNVHAQINTISDKSSRVDIFQGPRKAESVDIRHLPGTGVQAARNTLDAKGYAGKTMALAVEALTWILID